MENLIFCAVGILMKPPGRLSKIRKMFITSSDKTFLEKISVNLNFSSGIVARIKSTPKPN